MSQLSRRDFLRFSSAAAAGALLAACAAPGSPTTAPQADTAAAPQQPASTAAPAAAMDTPAAGGTMVFPWWFWEEVVQHVWNMHKVARITGGRLVDLHLDGTITPYVAESWELSDDRLTYTFKLRQGMKWHDGETVDASDVAFTLHYLVSPGNLASSGAEVGWGSLAGAKEFKAGEAESISGLEVVDDYTVRMTIPSPDGGWLTNVPTAMNILPEHIYNEIPVEDLQQHHAPLWFQPHMHVGTGPFKWVEGEDEKFVRLERFDDYYEGRPLLDGLLFSNVGESDTQFLALQKGEIDYLSVSGNFYQQALTLDNIEVVTFERPYHRWLDINVDKPYFQDVRVRQALNYAVDRQLLSETVLVGLAEPWYSVVEHSKWLNEEMPIYEYDPEKAKELLAAAAADGAWDPEREIELYYYYPDTGSRDFMAGLQKFYTDAGIKTRLIYIESAVSTEKSNSGEYDLMYSGWGATPDPTAYARGFACDDPAAFFRSYDPETCQRVWALFEQGKQLSDLAERKAVYDEIQQIYGETAIAVPLFRFRSAAAINKRIGGFDMYGLAWQNSWIFSKHNAHTWHIQA